MRTSNFVLYVAALTGLAPWFFALDRTSYARWVSVHIKDMLELQHRHPDIFKEFSDGQFTVQKTSHAFSGIPLAE